VQGHGGSAAGPPIIEIHLHGQVALAASDFVF
jgi:hypothetical protein